MNATIRRYTTEIDMDNRFAELDSAQQLEVSSYINALASNPGDAPFKVWHDYDCQDPEQRKQVDEAFLMQGSATGTRRTITQVAKRAGYEEGAFYRWRRCGRVGVKLHQAFVSVLTREWEPDTPLRELAEQRLQAVEAKLKALKARQVEHEQDTKRQVTTLLPLSQAVANKMGVSTPTNGAGAPSTALLARIREACARATATNRDARTGFPIDTDLAQALQDVERLASDDRTI